MSDLQGKVTLPYNNTEDVKNAAIFIATLIKHSTVVFETEMQYLKDKNNLVIKFSGGY